jgi:hypothetical protein
MIISVDFDGTLALGDTSNIPEMKPNTSLISILNEIYEDGNEINVVTARGSKSCNSFKQRREKYLDIIKNWLEHNHVSYNSISFFKEYADIYFDDKSINIKDSIKYEKLDSIFTQKKVRRLNDYVVKRSETSTSEYYWYKEAAKIKTLTAKVLSYDSDTITTKYIKGERFNDPRISLEILKNFRKNPPLNDHTFENYISRIKNHAENNPLIVNFDRCERNLNTINVSSSFNHGDFSIDNMIQDGGKLYLIDPIYSKDLFQSFYLDAAKHLFTILYYELNHELYNTCRNLYEKELQIKKREMDVLICAESIRVATYKKEISSISNNLIDALK